LADYPEQLVRKHFLFDGTQVTIRPVRPADAPMEQEFVRHLSEDSRYFRFMQDVPELSPGKLKQLTSVDYDRRMELVATVAHGGAELEIADAMYAANPQATECEFAIAVDDAWQGSGVAGLLMIDLIEAARSRGIKTMFGLVMANNHRMLKFVRQLGFSLARHEEDLHTIVATKRLAD